MIRRPPRATLFPSTTPFRAGRHHAVPHRGGGRGPAFPGVQRPADGAEAMGGGGRPGAGNPREPLPARIRRPLRQPAVRSEEHTSELQPRQYLGCRLLLEKNKRRGGVGCIAPPLLRRRSPRRLLPARNLSRDSATRETPPSVRWPGRTTNPPSSWHDPPRI